LPLRPARRRGRAKKLSPQEAHAGGRVRLLQLWEVEAGRGLTITRGGTLVLAGKSRFLPPQSWSRLYLPFKVEVEGGITISSALQREGIVSGVVRLIGGQLRMDVFNSTSEVVRLTPKTQMACLAGYSSIEVVRLETLAGVSAGDHGRLASGGDHGKVPQGRRPGRASRPPGDGRIGGPG